jgi:hypothetical protein
MIASLVLLNVGLQATERPKRKATIADSIEMTTLGDPQYELGAPAEGRVAIFSPQGDRFVVVLKKGDLRRNVNTYTMLSYVTASALSSPPPTTLVTMVSESNRPAIESVKWLADGKSLLFLGERDGTSQVFKLDVATKRLTPLTGHPSAVVAFDATDDGDTLLYEAAPPARKWVDPAIVRRDGLAIASERPDQLLAGDGHYERKRYEYGVELFVQRRGDLPQAIPVADRLTEIEPVSLSPDGRFGLVTVSVETVPDAWIDYTDRLVHSYVESYRSAGKTISLLRYMLVDFEHSRVSPLVDAPLEWKRKGWAWAKDCSSIVVSGAYLPLEGVTGAELTERRGEAFVLRVDLPSMKTTVITKERMTVVGWSEVTGDAVLRNDEGGKASFLGVHWSGSGWSLEPLPDGELRSAREIEVELVEDMNHPPKICVSRRGSRDHVVLLDLNPQFAEIQFSQVESVRWKATDGHEVRGGLYLPPDYRSGVRYPLVIQTHGFDPDRFWIDGLWTSAFAAQALAAEDIVVLQVGAATAGDDSRYARTLSRAVRAAAAFEGAIDNLDARGLIDRTRVGIIGFSYTVFEVEYTLTHSRYAFAAATVADGFDAGYLNYLLYPGDSESPLVNGGLPFGDGLTEWIRNSPGFNLDKVKAAVRIETYGFDSLLGGWQAFEGLKVLKKPVDYVWLPYATHLLVKPWERRVSQGGNLDWFTFWLTGRVDHDPAKAAQYARWRDLGKLVGRSE